MDLDTSSWLSAQDPGAAGALRRAATRIGESLGLPDSRIADLAIVASELGSNLYKHANDGAALVRAVRQDGEAGVEIVAIDRGPGMSDLASSSRDGHSTAGTLGIGLGAVARQSSTFDGYSWPGLGTVISAAVWAGAAPAPTGFAAGGIGRPMAGEAVSGDGFAVRSFGDGRTQVMVCDGLGHGPLAAVAAQAAEAAFWAVPGGGPRDVVEHLHRALAHTRGAVVMVAELDPATDRVRFAGLGNITGVVVDGTQKRMMSSQPGIAGHQRPVARELELPCPASALVVMHTDGVSDRWNLHDYPGLTSRTPVVIAATLLRDASVRRDDATVLVAKVDR